MDHTEGLTAPVCQALLTPMLWAGAPRNAAIMNVVLTLAAVIGFRWYWYLPIGLAVHYGMKLLTKYDPFFMNVLARAVGDADYYE